MALMPDAASASGAGHVTDQDTKQLRVFVMGLFFIFGGITSLNDVLIPKLKLLFTLNFTQAMLIQFCFFAAYFVIGIPGARLVKKIGYMRGAVAGLLIMMMGCLLFIPASQFAVYGLFLMALFVLASGVVIVQVVANPLISMLGAPQTAHSRLTFAQAFNSLGTTLFPLAGASLILGSLATMDGADLSGAQLAAFRSAESAAIMHGYLGIAAALAVVAAVVWAFRHRLKNEKHEQTSVAAGLQLLKRPRFGFGAACIFLYVGAEVAVGSLIVTYLMQPHVMALPEQTAGHLIAFYWGGAMVGRFIGSAALRVFSPGKLLMAVAIGAIGLILISVNSQGAVAGYSMLAVGLMNAIMFPTIFSLACEKLGARAADGSGIINVAICGGAIIPLLTGVVADLSGSMGAALLLPALCYAIIAGFGFYARRPAAA